MTWAAPALPAVLFALALTAALRTPAPAASGPRQDFPHAAHAGLFPLCTGCHLGVETGVLAQLYPDSESCASCHDGVDFPRVSFTAPVPGPSNLLFEHVAHARSLAGLGEPALACATCHASEEAPRMTVEPLEAGRCLACHALPGARHVVEAPCASCHVPLAESAFPLERIQALELPPDHEADDFILSAHGRLVTAEPARCATCHTRDLCVACHVDAARAEIVLLPPAPPGMQLPPAAAHYPVPESHRSRWFRTEHAAVLLAEGEARCATCHTRDDCASCHLPPLPPAAAAFPSRASVVAPGVGLLHAAPPSHAAPRFERAHAGLAAAEPAACAICHSEPFCVQCHAAPARPIYHQPDFLARHAAGAWARTSDCAACHETQVFCRSCHLQSGFGAAGRLGPGFHDAEPLWLLRHGQAARQTLESCASCHQQRDCLQCHSQIGAFGVSPHAPGFDARRAWERNPGTCLACHVRSPLGPGG